MKYCIDKSEFVVASGHIPVHMSQQNVANSIDNVHFSINLVEGFLAKTLNPNAGVQASFFNTYKPTVFWEYHRNTIENHQSLRYFHILKMDIS